MPSYLRFKGRNEAAPAGVFCPKKTIWAYSGFTLEEMLRPGAHPCCEATRSLLALLDVLVDGRFVEELRDISLRFRGSRNQRIIDLAATRAQGKLVLWSDGAGERGRLT